MYSLALEGGGAKGAFHMGAVRALIENGYEFEAIAGTSIGALNGAIITQGDAAKGYEMWESLSTSSLFDINDEYINKLANRELDRSTIRYFATKVKTIIDNKGIDTSKIRNIVENLIDEEKLRNSPIDFGLVTVSVTDLKPIELFKDQIPEGQIVDYLMASANFPGFSGQPIEGKHFADGGLYDNLPINLLASKGYKDVIAIRTHGIGISRKVKYEDVEIESILPSEDLGATLEFDNDTIKKNLQMGYYDALRLIKGLKGTHYYIEPLGEEYYFDMLSSMPDEFILMMGRTFDIQPMNTKRMLFEHIVPSIAKALDQDQHASYESILLSLIEVYAEQLAVERFAVYSLGDFLNTIREKAGTTKIVNESTLSERLLHAIKITDKKEQLSKVSKEIFELAYLNNLTENSLSVS